VKQISISDARGHLAELVEQGAYDKETVEITRRGKVLAVLVPPEDRELISRIEEEAERQSIAEARADVKKRGTVPLEKAVPKSFLERARRKHEPSN
jgi:prevent-host-death family protein